jgi:hypothetical protein
MATVLVLLGVIGGLWFWRSGRFGAIWSAMAGSGSIGS